MKLSPEMRARLVEEKTALFRSLCKRERVPEPVREHPFARPDRDWRFDFAWLEHRVALECDGGVWTGGRHTRGKGFLGDMEKLNAAASRGWLVFRCTPQTLDSLTTVHMIRHALTLTKAT